MNDTAALRLWNYRDAVMFALPVKWTFEDDPGVQGLFYEDRADSGTLRVSVFQWTGDDEAHRNQILKNALGSGRIETLAQGVYMRHEIAQGEEGGEALSLYRWLVALALPSNTVRLIVYTYTLVLGQESDPLIASELSAVEWAARNAKYRYEVDLPLVDSP